MTSRLVNGRYPPPGTSPIADAIRARRGERGITHLDAVLLHRPPVAEGWNTLLGAIRTRGALPGDIRELMILRVAAINRAAYEWIQHEPVGRSHGLTTAQLYIIRDVSTPLPPARGILSSLQSSALRFADASTRDVRVPKEITHDLMHDLRDFVKAKNEDADEVQDLFVEAAAVVATYNMVSRLLVSTDVGGLSDDDVPWPLERKEANPTTDTHKIHAITLTTSPSAPWIVLANSLLTDLTMWSYVVPYFIQTPFNILLHSQRGHGQSSLPLASPSRRQTTIPSLAYDIAHLIQALEIPTPIHAIVGVSQGGAAAIAFTALTAFFPPASLPSPLPTTKSIIACDTSARTPIGNASAWEGRASVAYGTKISFDSDDLHEQHLDDVYASQLGMSSLASIILPRWFPPGSPVSTTSERLNWMCSLIKRTPPHGFLAGAQALADYNLFLDTKGNLISSSSASAPPKVLLLAGALDGAGKVGEGMKNMADTLRDDVKFVEIPESGHLPMIDQPETWSKVVIEFLQNLS
ncbi:beta-ketoadipate enol-lactone hydrolase [Amanita muscaria]